jgi:hypothetical protein
MSELVIQVLAQVVGAALVALVTVFVRRLVGEA